MKLFFIGALVAVLFLGGYMIVTSVKTQSGSVREADSLTDTPSQDNVRIENGKQIVELRAKGGYTPKVSAAKAGIPTILRVDTSGTFDCSSSIRVPSLDISQTLPVTGTTDIPLGELAVGTFQGSCGMGMYPFQITVTN